MAIRYLHTMVRVLDLEASMAFYRLLGLEETRRYENEGGRFTLVFMAPPGQPECPVELTYNWDGDEGLPSDSRHFGHLAYEVDDIHATCAHLKANGSSSYVNHPMMEARHWAIHDGKDSAAGTYHRTHSGYAVAAFHEALRIILGYGRRRKASDYAYHEKALRQAVAALQLPHPASRVSSFVSVSVGCATLDLRRHDDIDDLIGEAAHALRQAKAQGRNRCVSAAVAT